MTCEYIESDPFFTSTLQKCRIGVPDLSLVSATCGAGYSTPVALASMSTSLLPIFQDLLEEPDNKTDSGCSTKAASHACGNDILQVFSLEVSSRFNGKMKEWSNSELFIVCRLTCYLVVHLSCTDRRKVNGVSWQQCLV